MDRFGTNQITIHFNTAPNRAYTLEASTARPLPQGTSVWSQVFSVPATPFPNHFIIVDTATNQQRFYRLVAVPR